MNDLLKQSDPEIYSSISNEANRQSTKLELIASENFVSPEVMEAQGSIMTNKYAEGYPGNRYYGGCEFVDVAENIARDRAKKLFNAEYANVQPHSGSTANMGVYYSFIKIGDPVLGLKLEHGGHLTHGSPVNFSGRFFNFIPYELGADGRIDYNQVEDLAKKNKPKLITVGASAYSRDIDYKKFREIADSVGAFLFADIAHPAGLIARGYLTNAVEYAHVTATTTHKTLRGPRGGMILLGKDFDNPFGIVAPKSGRTKKMSEIIDSWIMPGIQGGPLMHVIAAKAVAFGEALTDSYDRYIKQIIANTKTLCDELISRDYNIVSGGTDNHLMLIDLRNKDLNGKIAQNTLDEAGITCNKNTVPNETNSALVTSGIRLGTPALTTRGFKENDMKQVAEFIDAALKSTGNADALKGIAHDVQNFAAKFPLHIKF
ncbi:MAG: serine hydroxymethyltransferase [Ignavibacteria bacterium]|jgi:glycine hydroxymethyltransferase|nr:serine hydroxymethyltransferase [Ignavibacteria bacterium]